MQSILDEQHWREQSTAGALLVLFGGAHCGVCQAVRPRIEDIVREAFPAVAMAYVDCGQAPALCAQQGVFSLPVLRLYLDGQLALERARNFSLQEVGAEMERVLTLWAAGPAQT